MSDHDELKAAVERYQKGNNGKCPKPGYGHPYEYQHISGGWYADNNMRMRDAGIIADAFLAREELLRELVTALELSVETMNGLADQQAMESNWWLTNASIIRTVIAKAKEQLG